MSRTALAIALLIGWIAALGGIGFYVSRDLVIGTDLRLFLPSPTTPEQKLLLDEIGEGPASRMLVVAIGGAAAEILADTSRELAAALSESKSFRFVANGELSLEAMPDELLAYRYLLSPTLDTQRFDVDYLHGQLESRARDLSSPAGAMLEPLLSRDPTLEVMKLLQQWQALQEPNRQYDVWFDSKGERALLIVETEAPAFDPDRQRAALDELQQTFRSIDSTNSMRLTVSGPGTFSVLMEERTRGEAQVLGAAATIGMIVLMLAAYRRFSHLVWSLLPLVSAAVAGLCAVSVLFGEVHGITLAFGFTLIGVAQDYPLHLLSHQQPERSPLQTVRALWPTLVTGIASTCIAYATFLFSSVVGLMQLACFTVAALAVAGLTTRFLLPRLMTTTGRDYGQSQFLGGLWQRMANLPVPRWITPALAAICIAIIALAPGPLWENDLSRLTPVPRDVTKQDDELRAQLGTPDLRYLLVVKAADVDAALAQLQGLNARLQELIRGGTITGYDHAARYLPTREKQLERQQQLPDPELLRATLQQALRDTPFRTDAFEPFVQDVTRARTLPPLSIDAVRASPFGPTLETLLMQREGKTTALVTFTGVSDQKALQQLARTAGSNTLLLDLKLASESLIAQQRTRLLWSLAAAAILLIGTIAFALRNRSRVLRVLAPMALTTLLLVAVLHGAGIPLTLFHLIALILAAGLGLDYALFFEHAADDALEQRRTLHAVLVCASSTFMVFVLLAISSLPVLRAIGVTVSLGVVLNFVLALLLTRERAGAGRGTWGAGQKGISDPHPISQAPSSAPSDPSPASHAPRPISDLIPHQGSMCLLERIIEWDEHGIRLETTTHRSTTHPLRSNDRLRAIHLCEYGAQAMAVHGALRAQADGNRALPGMLVSLREVSFSCDYIEHLPGNLIIEARCLQVSDSTKQYTFRASHAGMVLAEGRVTVVLQARL